MDVKVFYASKTGNTGKVAAAMAGAIGTRAEKISAAAAGLEADLLFLGAAVYATFDHGPLPEVLGFIGGLDPRSVKEAVVFSTGFAEGGACVKLRALLERRGIKTRAETFFCPGRFLFFKFGHPNAKDLDDAREFAKAAVARKGR